MHKYGGMQHDLGNMTGTINTSISLESAPLFLSLFVSFQPLSESEYNSSPETVGYRLRVSKTDGQGENRNEDVKGTGGTSEATLEGLNPFTQYQVQIQALNSIGPGPWSQTVAAQTTESGMNIDLIDPSFIFASVQQRSL